MAKIFLVEDEIDLIEIYRDVLTPAGFDFEAVQLGSQAEEEFQKWIKGEKQKPDLILLDLVLPDTNGILLLEKLKQEKALKDIPVYILTNYTSTEMKRLGLEKEAGKYIVKTEIIPSDLVDIAKKAILEKK